LALPSLWSLAELREIPRIAEGSIASINTRLQAMWVQGLLS